MTDSRHRAERPHRLLLTALLALVPLGLGGCEARATATGEGGESPAGVERRTPTVVDSIFPVEEEIRRFQEAFPGEVTELSGGEASMDALVARFISAVEAADTLELASLSMTPREFGYLYYPTSRYTEPPYRLSPALVWYQNQNQTGRGLTRLLRRYAGHEVGFIRYECPEAPEVEGENRFWHGCQIIHLFEGDTVRIRLFGSIWERGGQYKLVGYANDF